MLVCMNVEIHLNRFFYQIFSAVMKCFNFNTNLESLLQSLLYKKRNFFSNDHNLT